MLYGSTVLLYGYCALRTSMRTGLAVGASAPDDIQFGANLIGLR
jgi:hypothetical protein